MAASNLNGSRARHHGRSLKSFFIPTRHPRSPAHTGEVDGCAIIPTFKPTHLTLRLVEDLLRWNSRLGIIVVDDCTPIDCKESLHVLETIRSIHADRVVVVRTPSNRLKAGALNYGLEYLYAREGTKLPEVVLTLDDDVVIMETTVQLLIQELLQHEDLGAACSQCHVLNKNRNLLTRLQGLEYLGFNATRLADDGFFMGPLVMHGMLSAFRTVALQDVGGFREGHLIEDYEITARLKEKAWTVKSVPNSHAWTIVPENFSKLWRQRTRWSYGGITVVDNVRYLPSVIQDLIGHAIFWATLCTVNLLILRTLLVGGGSVSLDIPYVIITLSLLQVGIWYAFQLWLMRVYREKDVYDWLIRISMIPEFLYVNVLTLVLLGSYFFLFFKTVTKRVTHRSNTLVQSIREAGTRLFRACGYTESWGTRTQ